MKIFFIIFVLVESFLFNTDSFKQNYDYDFLILIDLFCMFQLPITDYNDFSQMTIPYF